MEDAPQWVDAILDVLEGCIEGYSPGSFELRFSPEECQLIIAPALTEIVGGAEEDRPRWVIKGGTIRRREEED